LRHRHCALKKHGCREVPEYKQDSLSLSWQHWNSKTKKRERPNITLRTHISFLTLLRTDSPKAYQSCLRTLSHFRPQNIKKLLFCVLATNTQICTNDRSKHAHANSSTQNHFVQLPTCKTLFLFFIINKLFYKRV